MDIFVTGTDLGVGKTFIVSALASIMQSLNYKSAVYKPIQTGAYEQNGFVVAPDITFARKIDPYVATECSYFLKSNLSPVIAAELESIKINPKILLKDYTMLSQKYDCTIVEGTGGLMTPISTRFTMANMVSMFNVPLIVVAKANEDTVNDTLLTINHAHTMGLKVNGVILNKYPEDNERIAIKTIPRLIEEYSDTTVVGIIKEIPTNTYSLTPSVILDNVLNGVDIEKIFDVKIPKLDV